MSAPGWVANAVFYAIIPDRFARRAHAGPVPWNDAALEAWDAAPQRRAYEGGNLGGVTDRLDHLAALGVTAIYMTPIFQSDSYHRYKPVSFFEVDPLLGGDAAFDALFASAHRKGLRVVMR